MIIGDLGANFCICLCCVLFPCWSSVLGGLWLSMSLPQPRVGGWISGDQHGLLSSRGSLLSWGPGNSDEDGRGYLG